MFSVFETYLKVYASFTNEEIALIRSAVVERVIENKQRLLAPGDISRHYTFVSDGCLRTYRIDQSGTERILDLAPVNYWATEDISWAPVVPLTTFVEAVDDTAVIQLTGEDYRSLRKRIPAFEQMYQRVTMEQRMRSAERVFSMVSNDAASRYREFKLQFPNIYKHMPAYMIASYLGVARETISRIRASEREEAEQKY